MSRTNDVTVARAAADEWAAAHSLPPSGGYSAQFYQNGYLGGWWPPGWPKWWADYSAEAGSIIGNDIVAHQYTSTPVDTNVMLESEIVAPNGPATEPTTADFRQALSYLRGDVLSPLCTYKYPRIKAALAEVNRVCDQYGAS
jgi:hypothetical protein